MVLLLLLTSSAVINSSMYSRSAHARGCFLCCTVEAKNVKIVIWFFVLTVDCWSLTHNRIGCLRLVDERRMWTSSTNAIQFYFSKMVVQTSKLEKLITENKDTQLVSAARFCYTLKSVRTQRIYWTTYQITVQTIIGKKKVTLSFQKNITNWVLIEHQSTFEYTILFIS